MGDIEGEGQLAQARRAINEVDAEMAALFSRRMDAVAQVAAYKAARGLPIYDPEREGAVIARNAALVPDEIRPFYTRFLEEAMAVSREYQHQLMQDMRAAGTVDGGAQAADCATGNDEG